MNRKPDWPAWLETLRPDEVTRRRLHNEVMHRAEAMLRRPERTWHDITAGWSAVLTPIAAGLVVTFGTLAYRVSTGPDAVEATPAEEITLETHELQPLVPASSGEVSMKPGNYSARCLIRPIIG